MPRKTPTKAEPIVETAQDREKIQAVAAKSVAPAPVIEEHFIKDEVVAFGEPELVVEEPVISKSQERRIEVMKAEGEFDTTNDDEYFYAYQYVNEKHSDPTKRNYWISGRPDGFDKSVGQEITSDFLTEYKDYFDSIIPKKYGLRYFASILNPSPAGIRITVIVPLKYTTRDDTFMREMRYQCICFFITNLQDINQSKTVIKTKLPIVLQTMKLDQ